MDEKPGLRAVDPDESQPEDGVPESAAGTAMRLLLEAEAEAREGKLGLADVLSQLAQGWATLALTEPVPMTELVAEPATCPACGDLTQSELPDDWQEAVLGGATLRVVGCGNPWHYLGAGLHSQG